MFIKYGNKILIIWITKHNQNSIEKKKKKLHCSEGSDPIEERGTETEAGELDWMVCELFESVGEILDIVGDQIFGVRFSPHPQVAHLPHLSIDPFWQWITELWIFFTHHSAMCCRCFVCVRKYVDAIRTLYYVICVILCHVGANNCVALAVSNLSSSDF